MKKPRVSIITPYYNAGKFIEESLKSISNQFFNPSQIEIEHVLVNDCSTDDSNKIVNDFIKKSKNNIIYKNINTPVNLGCGGARKYGIDNSTGDYLMFLDGDDYYQNIDFVQRAVKDITSENADIVEYGVTYLSFFKKPLSSCVPSKIVVENDPQLAEIYLFANNFIKFHAWTKIISKKLPNKFDYSTRRQWEDVDTIPVWVSLADKIVIMPSVEINYRTPQDSIIMKNPHQTRIGTIEAISRHFERFKDNIEILKAMYKRAMLDFKPILDGKTSNDPIFNELSNYNTYMLSYIMPDRYKNFTYNLNIEEQINNQNMKE